MRIPLLLSCIAALASGAFASTESLSIFLRGGPKTHGEGQHDHPRFVDEWKELLTQRGARVAGALRFPTREELAATDVLVLYAADGGSIHGDERKHLDEYLARGGGVVALHDAVCGDDPHWWKTVIGGAWEHGHSKWREGSTDLYVSALEHPITRGAENFRFDDEIYWDLHVLPEVQVLAQGFHSVFDVTPQMWTYEKDSRRAFVSIQGHRHASFSHPAWRTLLLRGIAWAGKRDADLLLQPGEADALRYPPGGPTAPERSSARIDVHPDFELSLVAAEPLVEKPIAIDWDASGRAWVALTPGYPEKERFSGVPAHDEIAILVDRDADGRADERKTFFRGLDLVTGFVFHRDGVIVSCSPQILWLRDTDGDDVCDRREVLFDGFGFGDTHAVISNLRAGPDGWIYATQGYSGNASKRVTNAAGRDFGAIGNGLFRFRPDGSAIEVVSSYGSNTWGTSFAPDGELFFTMANGAHLRHVVVPERLLDGNRFDGVTSYADVPDHDRVVPALEHHDAPYAQIDFVGGFTAASGSIVYDGGAWTSEWNAAHFTCEPTVHVVHHDVLARKGVTFAATKARDAELIAGRDPWFRPVDVRVGPDGALYVLDFYNQAVVHNDTRGPKHGPTNAAVRPDRDHDHGRIWRVQHRAAKPSRALALARASTDELVAGLASANAWTRRTAQRLLVERADPPAKSALERVVAGAHGPFGVAHAAWCLHELGGAGDAAVATLLASSDVAQQHAGLRIAAREASTLSRARLEPRLLAIVRGADARSRLLALAALSELPLDAETAATLVDAWPRLDDAWSKSLAIRAARSDAALVLDAAARVADPERAAELTVHAARASVASGGISAAAALVRHLDERKIDARISAGVLRAIDRGLTRSATPVSDADVAAALRALLAHSDERVAIGALALVDRVCTAAAVGAGADELRERLSKLVADTSRTPAARTEALEALCAAPDRRIQAVRASVDLLGAGTPEDVQKRVLDAYSRADDAAVGAELARLFPTMSRDTRERAFELCATRASWSQALLDAVEARTLATSDLGPQRIHRLRNHPDPETAERAVRLFDALRGAAGTKVEALIAELLPLVDAPGDRERGKLVFKEHCAQCHVAFGAGGNVGPDLSGVGAHGARDLLPIVLDPNRAVEAAYSEWVVSTKDERMFSGVLVRDTKDAVVLRSSAGEVTVERVDIEEMRDTGRSPMPAGLETIGAPGLRDVIAYLAGDFSGFRVLDLKNVVTSSSLAGLYDTRRDAKPMKFRRYGIVDVDGIPFEVLDPRRTASGANAIVLKGGLAADWESKIGRPRRVTIPVGCALERVHVLGGIGGWAFPYIKDKKPVVRWTWRFDDGTSEDVELENGVVFADWIGRFDVPGSQPVDGVLAEDSYGQLRMHSIAPSAKKVVESIVLESRDNEIAPTFIALTAELAGARRASKAPETSLATESAPEPAPVKLLILGGGSSHDFARWFERADLATLARAGIASARYTSSPADAARSLATSAAFLVCTNQPLADAQFRAQLFEAEARGTGLLFVHPATWRNWPDWPEYNARLVGGGSTSHEKLQEFEVRVVKADHPIARGAPATFRITDELYRFEPERNGARIDVLAIGRSLETGAEYPVLWTVARARGRTVGLTLGHDGSAHEHPAFQTILGNAAAWVLEP